MAARMSADGAAFDFDAFRAVVHRHMQAEVAMDIEATLATVCDRPHYEFHPLGLIITSRRAVRALCERVLFTIVRAGRRLPIKSISLFVPDFSSGLVKGEHIYTNSVLAEVLRERLGPDFAALPGVTVER